MDHYLISLVYKVPFFLILIGLFFIGAFFRKNYFYRAFLLSYSVFFGFLLYVILLSKDFRIDYVSGLIFEFFVLFSFCLLVRRYFNQTKDIKVDYELLLRKLFFIKVLVFFFLVSQSGFGIFHSEEQVRISFLNNNRYNKYLVYLWSSLLVIEAVAVANTYSARRSITRGIFLIVVLNLLYSVLSGSKGGVILWLISVFALLPNDISSYFKRIYRVFPVFVMVFGSVVYFGASFEGLDVKTFLELVFNRFFLTNDSRALSLDFYSNYQSFELFFINSFRGIAGILGWVPTDQPLGNTLYEYKFGIVDGRGGNASYSALMNYYLEPYFRVVIAIFSVLSLLLLFAMFYFIERLFSNSALRLLVVVMSANLFRVLSQDFLAFPLVFVSTIFILFVFFIFRNTRVFGVIHER